jgi:hypothetical protein
MLGEGVPDGPRVGVQPQEGSQQHPGLGRAQQSARSGTGREAVGSAAVPGVPSAAAAGEIAIPLDVAAAKAGPRSGN